MRVGEKIRVRRIQNGLSMQELAERLGYANKSSVARIESGEIDPPQSKVVKFAEALGTSVADLMGWLDEENEKPAVQGELSEYEKTMLEVFRLIPEDQQKIFLEMGRAFANSLKKG